MRSELRRKGLEALRVDIRLVEARCVIVTDFAAVLGVRGMARRGFLEDRRQHSPNVLVELTDAPPDLLIRRDGAGLQPRAACVLVEIDARLDALIDRRGIDHGRQGLLEYVRRRPRARGPS